MDIIVAYCESWNTPLVTSKHHYLRRLAEQGHRVLYIEVPDTPLSALARPGEFLREKLPKVRAGLVLEAENIWSLTGIYPLPYHRGLGGLFDREWLNSWNQRAFLPRIQKAIRELDFDRPLILSYYPFLFPVLEQLLPSRVVLHMVDEWMGLAGIPRTMGNMLEKMLARADLTIVTSRFLYDRYKGRAKTIRLLRHGTDLKLFSPVAEGTVVADDKVVSLPGKKIGYYGALHKLDFPLIADVARDRADWSFVFVGPTSGSQGLNKPDWLPGNVHLWDSWPRERLPAFLSGLAAFWMPFEPNELSHAMCPIKLYEVLSAGVPIVCSDLVETRDVAGDTVRFAVSPSQHLDALEQAFSEQCAELKKQREMLVSDADWGTRIETFSGLLFGRVNTVGFKQSRA